MKRYILCLSVFLISSTLIYSQERTLVTGPGSHGGFGGPTFSLATINGEAGLLTGGWGAYIYNHTLIIGGAGYSLTTDVHAGQTGWGEDRYLDVSYGGVVLGLTLGSNALVHLTSHVMLGVGDISYRLHDFTLDEIPLGGDLVSVIQPVVGLEVNVTPWFRIAAGGNYRYVIGVDLDDLTNDDMSGVGGEVSFKFGRF